MNNTSSKKRKRGKKVSPQPSTPPANRRDKRDRQHRVVNDEVNNEDGILDKVLHVLRVRSKVSYTEDDCTEEEMSKYDEDYEIQEENDDDHIDDAAITEETDEIAPPPQRMDRLKMQEEL